MIKKRVKAKAAEKYLWGYLTTSTEKEAMQIAEELLNKGMIACGNLVPGMKSIYRWKGKVERAEECVLVIKTTFSMREKIIRRVKQIHSYDTPCIIFLPILSGNSDYLNWLEENCYHATKNIK